MTLLPFFFFNDTATTEIYTLSLHDALPICHSIRASSCVDTRVSSASSKSTIGSISARMVSRIESNMWRSEEHTSELQSHSDLVCRLLLEKKTKILIAVGVLINNRVTGGSQQ